MVDGQKRSTTLKGRPSNNPSGRPRQAECLTNLLREYLHKKDPETKVARKQLMVEELYRRAMGGWAVDPIDDKHMVYVRGSDEMLRYAFDRVDGKPIQALEHTGDGGAPIEVELTPDERNARILALVTKLADDHRAAQQTDPA